jgi:lactate permease
MFDSMSAADLIFAALPILLLIYWMTRSTPMPSAKALPLAAIVAYGIRLLWFGTEARLVHASVVAGLLLSLTPILIVWGAIFLFQTMEHSGATDTIRRWLNELSSNRVAQVVIIGWSFQFLIEGASGFGTPAALAGPLMVALGFPALRVAMACLILNSVPVSFGAVGTPTWFGFAQLQLSPDELRAVAWKTAMIHGGAACIIPLLAFRLLLSWQEIRRNLLFIYLALAASVVPMMLLATWNDEFPAVAGGLIGLGVTVSLARNRLGLSDDPAATEANPAPYPHSVARALFPLWATVLVLLLTRIPQLGLRALLTMSTPVLELPLGSLGHFSVSPALVLRLREIFGTDVEWTHQVLYVPSIIPFLLISVISLRVLKAPEGTARRVWNHTAERMRNPVLSLLGALALVQLLMCDEEVSSVMIIGGTLAAVTGDWWNYVAAYLGAIGSFFSGSCTISNLTFGPIQDSIAAKVGQDRTTTLALQSVGGAMGNMVAIHNIVAVCSVLKLANKEGEILKQTAGPVVLYGVIAAAMALVIEALSG